MNEVEDRDSRGGALPLRVSAPPREPTMNEAETRAELIDPALKAGGFLSYRPRGL